jgi:peptide/nickel transport system ATP-binding protein
MTGSAPVVVVDDLTIAVRGGDAIAEGISFELGRGEILGIAGESGSGKTSLALALLGYTRRGARIAGGSVRVAGEELVGAPEATLRRLRGRRVSYVPQDPSTALNPSMRIGAVLSELVEAHRPDLDATTAVASVLERVELPGDRSFRRRYPHQLSGGQQQRVAIAMAIVCQPAVVVFDEPTTGLDVVTQARILEEIARLRDELRMSMIYVSHNLAVVAGIANRIAVMYAGRIIEEGPASVIIGAPRHPYTSGLASSIPDHVEARHLRGIPGVAVGVGDRPPGCAFAPRCALKVARCVEAMPSLEVIGNGRRVRCVRWAETPSVEHALRVDWPEAVGAPLLAVDRLRAEYRGRNGTVVAARDVTFSVARGECLALIGESGSGKTTIARCIVGLHEPVSGSILLDGVPLGRLPKDRPREARRRVQIVFQNPYNSLNPRESVLEAVSWAARQLRTVSNADARRDALAMLERVRLPRSIAGRFPRELSGGERQRVAIARALVASPDLLVCDEVTSALDVSVQAAVLDLLAELRSDLQLTMLFITHDLGVVASIADGMIVLDRGSICEQGRVAEVLSVPAHDYTRRLLESAPRLVASRDSGA